MRMQPSIQGYVITEFTDINWESNGLLDMWRNPKAYARELSEIQQPDAIATAPATHNFWRDEPVEVPMAVSHYSERDLTDSSLVVLSGASEYASRKQLPQPFNVGETKSIGSYNMGTFTAVKPSRHNARVELRDRSDAALSTAEFTFFVYSRPAPVHSTLYVMNEDALAPALQTRGYRTAETHAPVMVAS